MTGWTASDIPPQQGRAAVVTGTGGLGFEDALALARSGGDVILAGRNPFKGADAVARIRQLAPQGSISFEQLDLASLKSIADFAERLSGKRHSIDILINNAGVMVPPKRQQTEDGFELQFGTNFLGHFALTAHLLPLLRNGSQPRVVTLSSIAAHPGISRTDLLLNAPGRFSLERTVRTLLPFLFQPAAQGALPALFAATAPEAKGGAYYGPNKMSEVRGHPAPAKVPGAALDEAVAGRLWRSSEQLTGISFSGAMIERATAPA